MEMIDKELLEKAAKVAGVNCLKVDHKGVATDRNGPIYTQHWNPLTDDGDAFRLAVKSGLIVDFWHERVIDGIRFGEGHRDWIYAHDHDGSMNRAITHAAAAMADK